MIPSRTGAPIASIRPVNPDATSVDKYRPSRRAISITSPSCQTDSSTPPGPGGRRWRRGAKCHVWGFKIDRGELLADVADLNHRFGASLLEDHGAPVTV